MKKKMFNDSLVIGLALFCMFFGAGNLVFPPFLGNRVGDGFWLALIGFLLTGVGFPFLSILACARLGGSYEAMGAKIGRRFTMVTMLILSLLLGPLAAIPRTAATAFELGVVTLAPGTSHLLSSFLYFAIVLFFVLKPTKILDVIGKVLTPILLVTLLSMVLVGIVHPIGGLAAASVDSPFGYALREGYNTMDALAGVIMATIPLAALKAKGYTDPKLSSKVLVRAGMISSLGLGIVYGGLMFLGAQTSGLGLAGLSRIDLLIHIAGEILGQPGIVVLALITMLACLSTAVVLMIISAEYFEKLFNGRFSYRAVAIVLTLFSTVVSLLDVDQIVGLAVPILDVVYPIIIVQIAGILLGGPLKDVRVLKATVGATLIFSLGTTLAALLHVEPLLIVLRRLPLYSVGFSWLLPSFLAMVGATLCYGWQSKLKAPEKRAKASI